MYAEQVGQKWGILGGLGPIASAEFVRTIYSRQLPGREQETPAIILYSDPDFPDRTESILNGDSKLLLKKFSSSLQQLKLAGADKIVVCCTTIHYLLPELPDQLRASIVSLLDIMLSEAVEVGGRHLLLCTTGARQTQLFERHPLWGKASKHIVFPSPEHQQEVHRLIYDLKRNCASAASSFELLNRLLAKYNAKSFIAGCTELHLLTRTQDAVLADWCHSGFCIDPLTIAADLITGSARAHCA